MANHTASITISGESAIGETLSARIFDTNGVPAAGIRYQWYYAGKSSDKIAGATSATYTPVKADVGKQIRVTAAYTDRAGNPTSISSEDYTPVAYDGDGGSTQGITAPAADAPTAVLSGPASVKEGSRATYTVSLDKTADQPVSVDVRLFRDQTSSSDAYISTKRVVIEAGQSSANFQIRTLNDSLAEGDKSYHVEISRAVIGKISETPPIAAGTITGQTFFPVTYKYPKTDSKTFADYWQNVWKAGKDNIPYVLVNPDSGPGTQPSSAYTELTAKNTAAGIQNIAYVSTTYQTRPIGEVKADIDRYFKFYGNNINGFFFDEISSRENSSVAYMAEIYNYVKNRYGGNKLVIANPGTHIDDIIAPYADIFVTAETSAAKYLGADYPKAASAFENNPANAHRIWHMVYGATSSQYQQIRELSKTRNAGWLFITDDSETDNNRYNDMPTDFVKLAQDTRTGRYTDPAAGTAARPLLKGAKIGNSRIDTVITDEGSLPPQPAGTPTVTLSGAASVAEGDRAYYFVNLDKPAGEPVTVGIKIVHTGTSAADANIRWHWQEVTVKAGATKAFFIVDAKADGIKEGNESYRVEIGNARIGGQSVKIANAAVDTVIIDNPADTVLPADAPTVTLSGAANVAEGDRAYYFVNLDKPAGEPVTVGIKIVHTGTSAADANIRWHWQEVTVKAGATKAFFIVDAKADGLAEGNESYRVEIGNARIGGQSVKIADAAVDTVIIDADPSPQAALAGTLESLGGTTFTGTAGADTFSIANRAFLEKPADLKNFNAAEGDKIALDKALFNLTGSGWFAAEGEAFTASTRVFQQNGGLFYDADGSGTAYGATRFADTGSLLKSDDFTVSGGVL